MSEITCVDVTLDIIRTRNGLRLENYTTGSAVFYLRWRSGYIGGCWDAQFNVIRGVNEIGSLQKGDRINIQYKGTQHWTGYVNDFISRDKDLEVHCIGAWVALNTVYPKNVIYGVEADEAGSQNEYSNKATAKEILEHLYDNWLIGSDITKVGLSSATNPTYLESKQDLQGTVSLSSLAQLLASNAGDWGVGITELLDFYLVNPSGLSITQFKTCEEAVEFTITAMEKQESIAWVDYPTQITVIGDGSFSETFSAQDFGYPSDLVQIAGVVLTNTKTVSAPSIAETRSKSYTSIRGESITETTVLTSGETIKSVSAARLADGIFLGRSLIEPEDYVIEAIQVNQLIRPWVDRVRIFDSYQQDRGVFVVKSIEYESESADINISLMEVKRYHAAT